MVAHNGQDWLPATLNALARLENRPGQLIALDAGSTDNSYFILQQAVGSVVTSLWRVPPLGFTQVVNDLVAALPIEDGWFWLLHDDSAPSPGCLTELLRVATIPNAMRGPAIVIPKLLRPKLRHRPDQVQSIGEAVSISGVRVVGTEAGDIDQQQDESMRALGSSTAGLLVRRDAWQALGGLSPQLPRFRAGVDLGWRANEAGLTVRTAPDATLRHQQAGLIGLRDEQLEDDPEVADLVAGLRVYVAHEADPVRAARRARLANRLAWLGAWLAKDTGLAHARAAALKRFRAEWHQTKELSKQVHRQAQEPVAKSLLPGATWGIKGAIESIGERFGGSDDSASEINLDALTADDDTVTLPAPHHRSWWGAGCAVLLLLATLVACRGQLAMGSLSSIGLAPAPRSLAAAWQAWLTPSAPGGANAPWLGIMALGSTLMGGQPSWWSTVLVLGGVFLAAWSAYRFARLFVAQPPARACLALLWALVLPLTGATTDGSPGWVMLAVALPWVAESLVRWERDPVKGLVGVRAPAIAALALTLASCVTPAMWLVGVAGAVVVLIRVRDWRGFLITVLAPLVLLAPWVPRLLADPGRLFTGVDPLLSRLLPVPDALSVLVGRIGLGHQAPIWVSIAFFGAVWLLGLIGIGCLPPERWRSLLLLGWVVALGVALLASRVTFSIDGQEARAAILPWLMVAALISVAAASASWPPPMVKPAIDDEAAAEQQTRLPSLAGHGHRVVAGAILVLAIGLGSLWWLWAGEGQPLQRQTTPVPDYVAASQTSPRATRTLVVSVSGGQASVSLRDANHPVWGSGEQSPIALSSADRDAVVTLAGQFAEGFATDDLAGRLAALGIGNVVISGVRASIIDAMAGVPDLAGGAGDKTMVWTVGGLPSRVELLVDGVATPVTEGTVPAGDEGRQLVLLESTDLPWRVSVGGVRLQPADEPFHYQVPAAGGVLRWWVPPVWWAFWWQLVATVALGWLAFPASLSAERAARLDARRAVA